MTLSIPAFSQVDYDGSDAEYSPGYYDDEAERLRQENDERDWGAESLSSEDEEREWEEQRRKERWLENEEIRRANERREWEARRGGKVRRARGWPQQEKKKHAHEAQRQDQLRLENDRREREAQRLAKLQLENEARERAIAKAAALEVVMEKPSQSGVVSVPSILEQLRKLGQLKDSGYLTELEFQELKKKLLDDQS